ncbi:hypothetical protein [uncultured Roseobacter sp.]|uniref:hypothetical protein n=1 Tax=uncultured Roseobacter sp. TaxID=114847 RepID=UPI0026293135|nr:hypothetical protein [uncultured Roseobacter sp.]
MAEICQDHGDLFLGLLSAELSDAPATVSLELQINFPVFNAIQEPLEGKGSERFSPGGGWALRSGGGLWIFQTYLMIKKLNTSSKE